MAIDFPNSPTLNQVFTPAGGAVYKWDGAKWTTAGVGGQTAVANLIVNGAMMVSQENGSTASTATGWYLVDQFVTGGVLTGAVSAQQQAIATPSGSPSRGRFTCTVAQASIGAAQYYDVYQTIEGFRIASLQWGTAAAQSVVIQFGVRAPAGTWCVAVRNGAGNRTYVAEYTIAAGEANTDVVKSVTIPGDTAGTWAKDSTAGMLVIWAMAAGTTYQTPAGAWTAGGFTGSANQSNLLSASGNIFDLFDVGVYAGSTAPVFAVPDYARELILCQRYFTSTKFNAVHYGTAGLQLGSCAYFSPMRAVPTCAASGVTYGNGSAFAAAVLGPASAQCLWTTGVAGQTAATATLSLNARL